MVTGGRGEHPRRPVPPPGSAPPPGSRLPEPPAAPLPGRPPEGEPARPGPGGDGAAGDDGVDSSQRATRAPSLDRLSRTLQRGAKISAFVLVVTQAVSFLQVLVVGRLLSPAEVGAFTAGSILVNFLTEFSEGGLKNALIQRQEDPEHPGDLDDVADTVFYATFIVGCLAAVAAYFGAHLIAAWIYDGDSEVAQVAAVTSGILALHALQNVPDGLMQRQFNFKRRLYIDPTRAVTFAGVAIVLSVLGFGIWGLVIALYASMILTTVMLWAFAGYRPGRGRASFRLWRELGRFAGPLVIHGVGFKVRELAEQALVGRFLGVSASGQYRYGRRIATLPGTAILQVASYVLFPAFARIASDPVRMRRGFLRAATALWLVSAPAGALLAAVGEPMIVVLLGEKWRGAGLAVIGMAGYGPGMALTAVGTEALKGAGASRRMNYVTAAAAVVGLGGLVVLLPLGLLGVGLAVSAEMLVSGAMCVFLALRYASVTRREALGFLVPPVIASAVAGVAIGALEHVVMHSDARPIVIGILLLVVDGLAFLAVFYAVLRAISSSSAAQVDAVLARLRSRLTKRRVASAPAVEDESEPLDYAVAVEAVRAGEAGDPDMLPLEITRAMWALDEQVTQQMWAIDDPVTRPLPMPPPQRATARFVPLRVVDRDRPPSSRPGRPMSTDRSSRGR